MTHCNKIILQVFFSIYIRKSTILGSAELGLDVLSGLSLKTINGLTNGTVVPPVTTYELEFANY